MSYIGYVHDWSEEVEVYAKYHSIDLKVSSKGESIELNLTKAKAKELIQLLEKAIKN